MSRHKCGSLWCLHCIDGGSASLAWQLRVRSQCHCRNAIPLVGQMRVFHLWWTSGRRLATPRRHLALERLEGSVLLPRQFAHASSSFFSSTFAWVSGHSLLVVASLAVVVRGRKCFFFQIRDPRLIQYVQAGQPFVQELCSNYKSRAGSCDVFFREPGLIQFVQKREAFVKELQRIKRSALAHGTFCFETPAYRVCAGRLTVRKRYCIQTKRAARLNFFPSGICNRTPLLSK